MKRLIGYSVMAAVLLVGNVAHAAKQEAKGPEGSVAGGFEASGVIDVLAGYTHSDQDANATSARGSAIGEFFGNGGPNKDYFGFLIDQVELDLAKTFGENIRFRADLDFQDNQNSGLNFPEANGSVFNLEQAYITVNIPTANGTELLIGKFNAPIGFEVVDRNDLITVSHSNIFNFVTPTNLVGAKVYAPFGDVIDLQLYIVNDLNNTVVNQAVGIQTDSAIPSFGARLGFTWGDEGSESTFGVSAAAGPEQPGDAGFDGENAHWDFLGDVDFNLQVTEALSIGGEGVYRQSNLTNADRAAGDTKNYKVMGGQLVLHYDFSDIWGGTFRYDYLYDIDPQATGNPRFSGVDQQIHAWTLAADYAITDGAKFKLEYKFEYADPAGANNSDYHSLVGEWAYNF